jgi:circadian clock protein KaiC
MTDHGKAHMNRLTSGVPNLDTILGGGFPEYSFNLIAGDPGAGKTTLCHQIMFANASPDRPALYFTVIGEPPIKMLRYQQQFTFFDPAKLDDSIHFVNLSREATEDFGKALEAILAEVDRRNPGIVIVDSFRSLTLSAAPAADGRMDIALFLQRLTLHLTSLQATTFLVGEYAQHEPRDYSVFTIADGVVWLSQIVNRNSMVRKIQAIKMRGQETQPGLHTVRITGDGVSVFPRMVKPIETDLKLQAMRHVSSGIEGLDEMLGGGIVAGSALLVSGPAGSGKSTVAIQFLAEGVKQGEPGVLAMFEETPLKYLEQAQGFGIDLQKMSDDRTVKQVYLRPLDLSVDETLYEIQMAVKEVGAKRVVIDSLTGLEIALAPSFEQDFRESLYRLIGALTGDGITILMTVENTDDYTELRFSPHAVSFMTNDIILQRYVEIDSQLRRVMTVIKTRSRKHSEDIRRYEINAAGLVVGERFHDYEGIIGGLPQRRHGSRRGHVGLTEQEGLVLTRLVELQEAREPALARRSGLQRAVLGRALRRLVELEYVEKVTEDGGAIYRPRKRHD